MEEKKKAEEEKMEEKKRAKEEKEEKKVSAPALVTPPRGLIL